MMHKEFTCAQKLASSLNRDHSAWLTGPNSSQIRAVITLKPTNTTKNQQNFTN